MVTQTRESSAVAVASGRVVTGLLASLIVLYAYSLRVTAGDGNPFDYFGYFTNLTTLLGSVVLIATGALMLSGRQVPRWLTTARAVATACILVVAVIYNALVPGTGSAPAWVSAFLHAVFPIIVLLDWILVGDRRPQPWQALWLVLPYPICWLFVVLLRGATDGWVPYGFLLPERGTLSLITHITALLTSLLLAGVLVWTVSRSRGLLLRSLA
ncbi:Pr6Pr family membrane protein [Microbacterium sulfonylureivorans]|uniref:Pr6Pr family membrane protein n=1 Tax=Microbacterium sulfonylureivorans TaxID=2486854 RepID=UPI00197B9EC2|nr:Pr6Pr family membrane protein [Microbacterium sulfonylureivorans]